MGKFFNGKVKKDRTSLIKYTIIGIGILVIIILFIVIAVHEKPPEYTLTLRRGGITMEIYDEVPAAEKFFSEIKGVDKDDLEVNIGKCDTTKVNKCTVTITGYNIKDVKTTLNVVDSTAPEVAVKEFLEIEEGATYSAEDFVEECYDNSKEDCAFVFAEGDVDENDEPIDYSAYTAPGVYDISFYAKDVNNNTSEKLTSTLIIGDGQGSGACMYGDLTVSTDRISFPIAVIVADESTGCALDKELWEDKSVQEKANVLYNNDYTRLQSQMNDTLKQNYPKGANVKVYPSYIAVMNDSLKGLVGYGIYVKVYVAEGDKQIDLDENLVLSYYLKSDGSRNYTYNKFNIGQ